MSSGGPRVAIVGYPNVGKSTLFNRLTGGREAVVSPVSGVTRDRKEGEAEWNGRNFVVVDTGGIDPAGESPFAEQVLRQARLAIEESSVVIFLVDGRAGVSPQDHEIASMLRRSRVPVLLAVNKQDSKSAQQNLAEYWELGLGEPIGISAEHGLGVGDLLDQVVANLPPEAAAPEEEPTIRIAIVGRPNVGKSSLLNALLGDERTIVSPLPGTTRDAIDTHLVFAGTPVTLVDTAGLRRPGKRTSTDVEYYSALRALRALERSDVALVVADASEGLVDLDLQIVYEAQRTRCATAVLFNKWDIKNMDLDKAAERLKAKAQTKPPWLTISALTGRGVERVLPLAASLHQKYTSRIPTPELNRWLDEFRARGPVPSRRGKALKVYYMVQYATSPPRFKVMINSRALINKPFANHLESRLRNDYEMWGIPLIIDFEGKEERYS